MQREHPQISRVGRRALLLGGALALAFAGTGTAFAATPNPIAAKEWALDVLQNGQIHSKYNARGSGVIVAVVDSGVDPSQPDLKGRLVDGVNLTDPSNPTSDFTDQQSESHGTSVATIIAANPHQDSSGNADGMLGLADEAQIMPIKVGTVDTAPASLAAGILYAVHHGAQVINISQANTASDTSVTNAVNTALADGVVVVVATGNDGESGNVPNTYATIPGVIDVAGIDQNSQIYHPGHHGSDVDVAAPANYIEVGVTGGQYTNQYSGTSLAAPWVSAEAALLIAEHPSWTSGQIVAAIVDNTAQSTSGQTQPGHRFDDYVGYGVIDPLAALGAAEPTSKANPLGGPAITSSPAQNVKASASSGAGASTPAQTATGGSTGTAQGKSSSKAPLIIVIAVVVVLLVALLIFLLSRRNRGGKGGPGGGGGSGNGYTAPQPPAGGQYLPPQQQNPYQQPQGSYPPQTGGGYGQQNPYSGN